MYAIQRAIEISLRRPLHVIAYEEVEAAVLVVIDECRARTKRFRQIFLTERAVVVDEIYAGCLGDVGEVDFLLRCAQWCEQKQNKDVTQRPQSMRGERRDFSACSAVLSALCVKSF